MLQKYWGCKWLETFAGIVVLVTMRRHSPLPFAKPSRLRGMYMLHGSMCFAHGVGRLLRRHWWFCYHAQALPTTIRKSFVKITQDLLMWGVTAYAAFQIKASPGLRASTHPGLALFVTCVW